MKIKTLLVLLLAGAWGIASWWWYSCKIKGFCEMTPAFMASMVDTGARADEDKVADVNAAEQDGQPDEKSDDMTTSSGQKPDKDEEAAGNTKGEKETTEADVAQITGSSDDASMNPDNAQPPTGDDELSEQTMENSTPENEAATELLAEETPSEQITNTEILTTEKNTATESPSPEEPEPEAQPDPEPLDNDGDGVSNAVETRLGLNANHKDSDGDGLNDRPEIGDDFDNPLDTDQDGVINALDDDDDGDGDLTIDEMPDPNQDGEPDDAQDINTNGVPDYLEATTSRMQQDDDGDGLSNGEEKLLGSNPTLTDSDGDGLSDQFEAGDKRDSDNDNTPDVLDPDDDDDGIMTVMENADPNGDGDPQDAIDSNDNGIPDYLDTDDTPAELPESAEQEISSTGNEEKTAPMTEEHAGSDTESVATDDDTGDATEKPQAEEKENITDSDKVTIDTSGNTVDNDGISKARLYFPFRSSEPELADNVARYFDLIVTQLKNNPDVKIRVTGHTDSVGRGAANRRLGRERAEQVRDMLVKQGAPSSQILVDSKGEGEPIADNQTEAGRKKNRRVELEQVQE